MLCLNCGTVLRGRKTKYCSNNCKLTVFRRVVKEKAVAYKGGKCERCNYSTCMSALAFHHVDGTKKTFGIAGQGITRSWQKIKEELDKCMLLCHNCHAEYHSGLWEPHDRGSIPLARA